MRVCRQILLSVVLATLSPLPQSARILAVLSIVGKSHHGFMVSILRALTNAGHEVVLYSNFKLENSYANFTDVLVESTAPTDEEVARLFTAMKSDYPEDKCWDAYLGQEWFQKQISSEKIKRLISSNGTFDLVITEAFTWQEFNLIFGYIFKAPTIAVSAIPTTSIISNNIGNSLSITSLPNLCALRPFNMSFIDRFLNAYYLIRRHYIYYNHQIPSVEREMRRHFSDMPPLSELIQNVSLVFVNDHPTASYAQPRTPSLIPVAGIHIRPTKPLPKDILRFMDEAQDGVIIFSLGTFVPDHVSSNKKYFEMLRSVFESVKQRVLWKTKQTVEDLPPNVLTTEWLPQTDILAHKNCILFITHGGINSQIETIHYGVPVVVVPYIGDQPNNAMLYVIKGVGVMLEPSQLSKETLSQAIGTVLHDPAYARRMKSLSTVFRDRPMSPERTVVYWTEYVLRHGGAPHLSPPPQPFYQRALLDVAAAILLTTVISFVILCFTVVRAKNLLTSLSKNRLRKFRKTD